MLKVDDFNEKLKEIYPNDFESIFKTHFLNKPKTFRVNSLKSKTQKVLGSLRAEGFEIGQCKVPGAYTVTNSKRLSESKEFEKGNIYIQGVSSMLAPIVLDPKPKEKILDLCAAPGSKTTQIAAMTNNEAEITAVEENRNRFFKLKDVINRQEAQVNCVLADGVKLPFKHPEFLNYFDKILVDAPCTSEAEMDLNDSKSLKFWRRNNAPKLSKLQKGLLNSGVKMLKPDGTLIYSTCTYSVEENELVLDWILKRYPNLKIEKIELQINNIQPGRVEWKGKELNHQIKNSVRIIPNEYFNGFFIAKIVNY